MITFGIWQLDYTNMLDMRSIMIYVYVESEFLRFVKFRFFDLLDKFKGKIYEDLLYRYHFFKKNIINDKRYGTMVILYAS